jgi:hypothetical protein
VLESGGAITANLHAGKTRVGSTAGSDDRLRQNNGQ